MQYQFFTPFRVQLPATASQQWRGDSRTIQYARGSASKPNGSDDTGMGTVETQRHLGALTQHVAGRLAVPGFSASAEVKVVMDSGSFIAAILEELVDPLRR